MTIQSIHRRKTNSDFQNKKGARKNEVMLN